jgi:anaerobic magnesium-protoporphyrin IX monomethyl ester cyclase
MSISAKPVSVLVPPVVCHNLDPHTGIPFLPHMAGHMAGALHESGFDVTVIDCFGLQPHQRQIVGEFMLMGVDEDWVVGHIPRNTECVYIYCRTIAEFIAVERLAAALKTTHPHIKVCLFENIQSVTSFSLSRVAEDFLGNNCDAIILGEPERRAKVVTEALCSGNDLNAIPGMAFLRNGKVIITESEAFNTDLDALPFPLWERFPLEGYWLANFTHAPKTKRKFLPILTSRGCPYRCTFCISPELNPTWRGRSAINVVDEMEYFYRTLGIEEFHVSDLDPTVNDKRTKAICEELIARDLPITWKLAQGTKIETIKSTETLELMSRAGCNFVAFSPESGSSRLLKIMNKPFNHDHALTMAKKMSELGISTQACFIIGVPGETQEDQDLTISYVKQLMEVGVNEIAAYIFAPIPGAKLSESLDGYKHYSQCTFSPTWREDYEEVLDFRKRMYITYFGSLALRPLEVLNRIKGILLRRYRTKMEMSLLKQIKLYALLYIPWAFRKINAERYFKEVRVSKVGYYRNLKKEI